MPALLEAYDIPYVFSDALTLASDARQGAGPSASSRDAGVPTAGFRRDRTRRPISRKIALPFPLFLKPVAEGSGKGVNARSQGEQRGRAADRSRPSCWRASASRCWSRPICPAANSPSASSAPAKTRARSACMEIIADRQGRRHDYGYENKERCDDNVDYRLIDDAEARAAARCRARGVARAALPRRRPRRYPLRRRRPAAISSRSIRSPDLNPEHSDLCFLARFKGLAYQELIGLIMSSFLKRHPELASRRAAA